MNVDRLRQAVNAQPFRPFQLRFGSGQFVQVPHPELIAIAPSGRYAYVCSREQDQHIDVMLIESIEYTQPETGDNAA